MDDKVFDDVPQEHLTYYFNIKYRGTKENKQVHDDFKAFCNQHTEGNYLMGISRLLEQSSLDWKYQILSEEIELLKQKLIELEQLQSTPKEPEKVVPKRMTFG
jgi:hypothetical protein